MSDYKQHDAALSLEDLFLSREFGRPRNGSAVATAPTLFRSAPLRGPLVPRAATSVSGMLVGHDSTSHLRRNRTFAAVSGVAAALLVAVGLVTHTSNPPKAGTAALGTKPSTTTGSTPSHKVTPTPQSGTPVTQPTGASGTGTGTSSSPIGLADFSSGNAGGSSVRVTPPPAMVTGQTGNKGGTGTTGTTKPTVPTTPAPTAPGGALAPVVTLVGHAVTTVGNTATTLTTGLGVTLPAISPVTNVVGGVGGDLSLLGDSLSGTII